MATVTGNWAVNGTLTANTAQAIELYEASDVVTVVARSASEIWFRAVAGTTAPVAVTGGVDCYCVPAVAGASVTVRVGVAPTSVSVISTGTPTYAVYSGGAISRPA